MIMCVHKVTNNNTNCGVKAKSRSLFVIYLAEKGLTVFDISQLDLTVMELAVMELAVIELVETIIRKGFPIMVN